MSSDIYKFNVFISVHKEKYMQGKYKNKAYPLRIDENIMNKLREIAEQESRTLNKQIEYILRQWLEDKEK